MENKRAEEPLAEYSKPLDFEQVWQMFRETDQKFQDTDLKFRETERMIQENDKMLTVKFQETDKQFKETDKKIKELSALFTSQWGKLVESLVEGDLIRLLNGKGIQVKSTMQRVKGNHEGENYEYDIIAENSVEIVIVEVKTTLRPQDVTEIHEKLWKAKKYLPRYREMAIYGALAFITAEGHSDRMAENQGLFVIRATGSSASIVNQEGFIPKAF